MAFDGVKVDNMLFDIEARIVRGQILAGEPRIDGRDTRTVRAIEIRNSVLPRTHGSACSRAAKRRRWWSRRSAPSATRSALTHWLASFEDRFLFHYNMPPFATGEVGRMGSTKRREVGHGRWPSAPWWPVCRARKSSHTIRVVSEITESNGSSSSMASVCGGCLSMMDAACP